MTSLDAIRDSLPDYARDLRLNLGSVLSTTGAPGLTERQIWAVALAAAIAARHVPLARDIKVLASAHLAPAEVNAAQAAAAVMGMNNIYYRFLHLVEDAEYKQLPARLRMNVLANPGIDKQDFELLSLAVSAINGCGTCVASHERQLRQQGLGREAVQSAVRIAAVIHAVAGVLESEAGSTAVSEPQAA
ncbi:MAG TPA: carboxymuconolactone decarboxylase family protein [Steroidobacteraceae bacterium]|nr:carboxymuconolactone decarboxylase family protein [Steroidobacteraceae bacterium]